MASNRGGLPETIGNSPHPNPLPAGEGSLASPHPNPLPAGEGTLASPHPNPLPAGEGTSGGFLSTSRPVTRRRRATCPRPKGRALGRDHHSALGRSGRVWAAEPSGAGARPAMASRPVSARLPRVLQPSHASARPSSGAEGSRQNMTSARGNKTAANHAQVTLDRSSWVGRVERVPPSCVVHRRKMVGLAPLGPPYHYACSAPIPVRAARNRLNKSIVSQGRKRCQEPLFCFLGRPRGRSVLSRPNRQTICSDHKASPKGHPRFAAAQHADNSASVCGESTSSTQFARRRNGQAANSDFCWASPCRQR